MIEIYAGEPETTLVVKNSWSVESVTGIHTLYDEFGKGSEVEYDLDYDSEPIGSSPVYKNLTVQISELSEWPTDFRIEVNMLDGTTPRTIKNYYSVVVPYASLESIIASGNINVTNQDEADYKPLQLVKEMEAVARHVIESYTGRFFGRRYGATDFDGTDRDRLYSDEHFAWVGAVSIRGRGEAIYPNLTNSATYEVSPSGHLLYVSEGDEHLGFPGGYRYTVVGIFGERSVPTDVELAAKMLTIHYLCSDAASTNAYIEQTKWGESATKTNRMAFIGTGLMAVDRILEKYRFHNYRVL